MARKKEKKKDSTSGKHYWIAIGKVWIKPDTSRINACFTPKEILD